MLLLKMVLLSFNCNYLIKSCVCAIIYILFVFYATGKMWSDGIGQEEVEGTFGIQRE